MAKTISTHNGSAAHRDHNIRNPKVTRSQAHIDPNLEQQNEILHDEPPREAYRRIFGAAVDRYNAKQSREDRKIKDYYTQIQKDAKKHPVYEMIVQIGDRNDTGINAPVERECLKEFYAGWAERNPNLECIGAYIHADETAGTLHMHLDYVPVAHGYRRGMDTQTGLVKALGEMGFEKNKHETAQIQWQRRENDTLEQICMSHGIQIQHPMRQARKDGKEKARHYETSAYIEYQKTLERCEQDIAALQEQKDSETAKLAEAQKQRSDAQDAAVAAQNELTEIRSHLEAIRPSEASQPVSVRKTLTGQVRLSPTEYQALTDEAKAARAAIVEADGLKQQVKQLSEELKERPSSGELFFENLNLKNTVERLTERLSLFVEWATDRLTSIWEKLVAPLHAKNPEIWSFRQAYRELSNSDKHEDKKWVSAYLEKKPEIRKLEHIIGSEKQALNAVLQRVTKLPADRIDQISDDATRPQTLKELEADLQEDRQQVYFGKEKSMQRKNVRRER